MILEHIDQKQLALLFEPYMGEPAWPGLTDAPTQHRAREYAQQSGLWDRIAGELSDPNLPVLSYSDYCDYRRTGSRQKYETLYRHRRDLLQWSALALWLEHPAASLDGLQDLLWAWCESRWELPAHSERQIELGSSLIARMLAEFAFLFRSRLDPAVCRRVDEELARRILDVALDWRRPDGWATSETNWNLVCNANLIQTALYQIRDPVLLAAFAHPIARRMDYALAYFTADGACPEGASYWEYGFGHFIEAALVLHHRTGGIVNLADDPHVAKICRFPLAVHLRGEHRASFGDCTDGYHMARNALAINRLQPVPDLFRIVATTPQGLLQMEDMRTLAIYHGERPDPTPDRTDYLLPDQGFVKLHSGNDVILAAIAGRNDVAHNHNDIGSFILMAGPATVLTDPGAPVYSAKTFSSRRYEQLFCRSRGHSVPLINGLEQAPGGQYAGTIQTTCLNTAGDKCVTIDMSGAYPDPTLARFQRRFDIRPTGQVQLTDSFAFHQAPRSLEEVFVTFEPAQLTQDRGVRIGAWILRTSTPGQWSIESVPPAEHEGRVPRDLHRLCFLPAALASEMTISFDIGPAL